MAKETLNDVTKFARSISLGNFDAELDGNRELSGELGAIAYYLDRIRRNLAGLEVLKGSADDAPDVSQGLREINKGTENATHRLLALTENLLERKDGLEARYRSLRERYPDLMNEFLRINEAERRDLLAILENLSFQDLMGQRLKKAAVLIEDVEKRLLGILAAFKIDVPGVESDAAEDTRLDQGVVDDILEEFGF
jgi:chemotaxis regulatin CheY-phosphate phosphatase CheZ